MDERFLLQDGMLFKRLSNGDIEATIDGKVFVIDYGGWASLVLTMSIYGEDSGYWHKFVSQHNGPEDILSDNYRLAAFKEGYELGQYGVPITEERVLAGIKDPSRLTDEEQTTYFYKWHNKVLESQKDTTDNG